MISYNTDNKPIKMRLLLLVLIISILVYNVTKFSFFSLSAAETPPSNSENVEKPEIDNILYDRFIITINISMEEKKNADFAQNQLSKLASLISNVPNIKDVKISNMTGVSNGNKYTIEMENNDDREQ